MNLFGPLARAVVLGGAIVLAGVVPALAAPADIAALLIHTGRAEAATT